MCVWFFWFIWLWFLFGVLELWAAGWLPRYVAERRVRLYLRSCKYVRIAQGANPPGKAGGFEGPPGSLMSDVVITSMLLSPPPAPLFLPPPPSTKKQLTEVL